MLHAVIMAGGAGSRFWPASRVARPKQLLDLAGEQTMIQATAARLSGLVPPERILVVTNRILVDSIAEQLPQLPRAAIVGEPCKRDTAPCIGLASALIARQDPDAVMVVTPADQVIHPVERFQHAIGSAVELVQQQPERIVTFGIKPSYPAETFGYIERGDPLAPSPGNSPGRGGADVLPAFAVRQFREKPSAQVAQQYMDAGRYYWNSGIFVWRPATIMAALQRFEPEMYGHLAAIAGALGSDDYPAVLEREFAAIQGKSIDFAVMERYDPVVVIEADFAWDDVGSWQSLARLHGVDADGNTAVGRHLGIRTSGSIVRTDAAHLVVTLGVQDLIVVHTPDATLVANKGDEESIRQVVKWLQEHGWNEYL